jgi:hypothetical protein
MNSFNVCGIHLVSVRAEQCFRYPWIFLLVLGADCATHVDFRDICLQEFDLLTRIK